MTKLEQSSEYVPGHTQLRVFHDLEVVTSVAVVPGRVRVALGGRPFPGLTDVAAAVVGGRGPRRALRGEPIPGALHCVGRDRPEL